MVICGRRSNADATGPHRQIRVMSSPLPSGSRGASAFLAISIQLPVETFSAGDNFARTGDRCRRSSDCVRRNTCLAFKRYSTFCPWSLRIIKPFKTAYRNPKSASRGRAKRKLETLKWLKGERSKGPHLGAQTRRKDGRPEVPPRQHPWHMPCGAVRSMDNEWRTRLPACVQETNCKHVLTEQEMEPLTRSFAKRRVMEIAPISMHFQLFRGARDQWILRIAIAFPTVATHASAIEA
uniref:Uncharacterized protein n=1 Tax=Trichuris muris TaxID=70415 RepID=A0A5S6Q7B1_TRIMR